MHVVFTSSRLRKDCTDPLVRQRRLGMEQGLKVQLRLTQLHAAPTLADLALLPQARFHELTGNRKGQCSVDLNGPYRLIFEVLDDPIPRQPNGGLDLSRVQGVRILEITDPH